MTQVATKIFWCQIDVEFVGLFAVQVLFGLVLTATKTVQGVDVFWFVSQNRLEFFDCGNVFSAFGKLLCGLEVESGFRHVDARNARRNFVGFVVGLKRPLLFHEIFIGSEIQCSGHRSSDGGDADARRRERLVSDDFYSIIETAR